MLTLTIFLKDHKRMPIRIPAFSPFRDVQADIPAGWCICCGGEVFDRGQERCIRCRKERKG